ncbi:TATA box-binding protein-associated factor RNA polymerase I subunit A-like isoform X1 [Tubulanus polymorphus]|uniref:TATA box-binding protein-associated factor RNA polymerase I subunit A-like isoform X1 n=1 Tax=Tubulanus polymorphus TaxID=672921 RepID=UPI003DA34EC3
MAASTDQSNIAHVQVKFFTKQEQYSVPDDPFSVPSNVTINELSDLINGLIKQGSGEGRKVSFDFLIDGEFLRSSLQEYIENSGKSTRRTIALEFRDKMAAVSNVKEDTNELCDNVIKLLCFIIERDRVSTSADGDLAEEEREFRKFVTEHANWVDEWNEKTLDKIDFSHNWLRQTLARTNSRFRLLVLLLNLLREQVLDHRWVDALHVFSRCVYEPSTSLAFLWRLGSEILLQYGEFGVGLRSRFEKRLRPLLGVRAGISEQEVLLDEALALLALRRSSPVDLNEADDILRSPRVSWMRSPLQQTDSDLIFDIISFYRGLIAYVKYRRARREYNEYNVQLADGGEEAVDILAMDAADALAPITDGVAGRVWDIFIAVYVEVLEHLEEFSVAQKTLIKNADSNSDNPNAHVLLYEFYKRHPEMCDSSTHRLKPVEDLVRLVPSHRLAIDLHDEYRRESPGNARPAVAVLFNALDYVAGRRIESRPWKLLADDLVTVATNKKRAEIEHVKTLWKSRADWWPAFHFNSKCLKTENEEVLLQKSRVAAILFENDSSEFKNCLKLLPQHQKQLKDLTRFHETFSS